MKDRRKPRTSTTSLPSSLNAYLCFSVLLLLISGIAFSTLRLFLSPDGFRPKLLSSLKTTAIDVISADSSPTPALSVRETVLFPDQVLVFIKHPQSTPLFTKDAIDCVYFNRNSSHPQLKLSPISIDDDDYLGHQIVRCPIQPRGFIASVALKSDGYLQARPTAIYRWDWLVYEALIDRDNTTVVFAKGLRLRGGQASNASRFECVYGSDFRRGRFVLRSHALSVAQEIVRCITPSSILNSTRGIKNSNSSIKVSVRVIGKPIFPSIARSGTRIKPDPPLRKQHKMCVCTMLRNQARFLPEWVMYHSRIGVQRWFIYDNNSDDDINDALGALVESNFNITRHIWPWIKTQEAGFAHCALRARDSCEWVGFIDVDEFFHLPTGLTLDNVLSKYSRSNDVAELRTLCYSFGPSGLKQVPPQGVTIGYTCRMRYPERHKSIIRPDALNSTLINMVHHFHLRNGFGHVNLGKNVMVINHYKYQVWEVFKEKFHRRVATYVIDWQQDRNAGSKDRAPGLGTRAVEPPDWSTRFCEVKDRGLRNRIMRTFVDSKTGLLPWQIEKKNENDESTRVTAR
ncbi:hypothetical protein LguiA_017001 [Lonicera macranthoides]